MPEIAIRSDRPNDQKGIKLNPLKLKMENNSWKYSAVKVDLDPKLGVGEITILGPNEDAPDSIDQLLEEGDGFWPFGLQEN